MRLLPLFLCLALSGALVAQAPAKRRVPRPAAPANAPAASTWPIASIAVKGARNYTPAQIIAASGLKIGQIAGKNEFESARERLLATGVFESVGYEFGPAPGGAKFAATLTVDEIDQVYPFDFEGLSIDPKQAEAAFARLEPLHGKRIAATEVVLKRYTDHVKDLLRAGGKPADVVAKLVPDASGDLKVLFRPASLPAVAEVSFRGNAVIRQKDLQSAIAGAAVGAGFTEDRFQQILDSSVRPLYEAQGRLGVRFPKITTRPAEGAEGLAVEVTVDEGEVYNLGQVTASGAELTPEMIRKAGFKPGETADFRAISASVSNLQNTMRANGYIHAEIDPERKVDSKEKKVDLSLKVTPGERYTMGKLEMRGLDITSEPYIRKLWTLKSGQAFNATYPEYFLSRLQADGVFENLGKTRSETKVDEKNRVVDVTLHMASNGSAPARIGPDAVRDSRRRPPR